jgi:hypothetical protein
VTLKALKIATDTPTLSCTTLPGLSGELCPQLIYDMYRLIKPCFMPTLLHGFSVNSSPWVIMEFLQYLRDEI